MSCVSSSVHAHFLKNLSQLIHLSGDAARPAIPELCLPIISRRLIGTTCCHCIAVLRTLILNISLLDDVLDRSWLCTSYVAPLHLEKYPDLRAIQVNMHNNGTTLGSKSCLTAKSSCKLLGNPPWNLLDRSVSRTAGPIRYIQNTIILVQPVSICLIGIFKAGLCKLGSRG